LALAQRSILRCRKWQERIVRVVCGCSGEWPEGPQLGHLDVSQRTAAMANVRFLFHLVNATDIEVFSRILSCPQKTEIISFGCKPFTKSAREQAGLSIGSEWGPGLRTQMTGDKRAIV